MTGFASRANWALASSTALAIGLLTAASCTSDSQGDLSDGAVAEQSIALGASECPRGSRVIHGTDGDDVLVGTSGADCILGYGGDDRIDGRQGRDVIFGGAGDDELHGGQQDDVLWGGDGDDTLFGDQGKDTLLGETGNDLLDGGEGKDDLLGGPGCDRLDGRNGKDTLFGGDGDDVINGGRAPERAEGGSGADWIAASWADGGDGVDHCRGTSCEAAEPRECGAEEGDEHHGSSSRVSDDDEYHGSSSRESDVEDEHHGSHSGESDADDDRSRGDGDDDRPRSDCDDDSECGAGDECVIGLCVAVGWCGGGSACPVGDGGIPCDDGNACNGSESCVGGACTPGAPLDCSDGSACTIDSCVAASGCLHVPAPDATACADGDACNGDERCAAGVCAPGTALVVDDGDACTIDSCDPILGVRHDPAPPSGGPDSTCDGVDDDCDGTADEDFIAATTECGVGACVRGGATSCVAGAVVDSCSAGTPAASDTSCDGVDDDCDGSADEGYMAASTTCGVGTCVRSGATSCVAGAVIDSCTAGTPAGSDATCDGIDDDCDGSADEEFTAAPTTCGVGACAGTGTTSCVAGAIVDSCVIGTPAGSDSTCDGVDDDCDGTVDEDYASTPTACGVGACLRTGATVCVMGAVLDSCIEGMPAAKDASCDGVDDDCDGANDEEYAPAITTCGVGVCASTGTTSCAAGAIVDSCTAGAPAGTDATCDGADDDCDGTADEDFASMPTACGVGACASTGGTSCIGGAVVDSCTAGVPAATDATCDGVDDDCDGTADEEYAPTPTACGVGACASAGSTSCVAGAVSDSCTVGTGAPSDPTCDGVDDDCDGSTDEEYAPTPTTCGVGACSSTGSTSCVAGAVSDSCTVGTGAPSDSTCDGVDDDCDGSTDEEYVPASTMCGVGACASTGLTSCAAGVVVDSCAAGTPAPIDATCNAIDDDCDGSTDEEYVPASTTCGVGACASTGATSCSAGAIVDSCAAGTPAASDATCDGVDDDCDGGVDEEYVVACAGDARVLCTAGGPTFESCADGNPCNGAETCTAGVCGAGAPLELDDANLCTIDSCDPVTGLRHDPVPFGTSCEDGDPCNGFEQCAGGVCYPGPAPTEGPCAPPGPTAQIFVDEQRPLLHALRGASLIRYTGTRAPNLDYVLSWFSDGTPPAAEVVVDLPGEDVAVLGRLDLTGGPGFGLRHFEVWASETTSDPAAFTRVLVAESAADTLPHTYELPATRARFVMLRLLQNWNGQLGQGQFNSAQLYTRPRDGGAMSLFEAGATSTASSSGPFTSVREAHDASNATAWTSASGEPIDGQFVRVDLLGADPVLVDRVRIFDRAGDSSMPGDFEIWTSATGTASSDFALAGAFVLPSVPAGHTSQHFEFFFPEVRARHVELRLRSTRGVSNFVSVYDFQVLTAHEGSLAVPLEDRATPGANPLADWEWDFGDGGRSALRAPTHTYSAPGSYLITLRVRDTARVTSTATFGYTAHAPPNAFFTYTPASLLEGGRVTLLDRTVSDVPLIGLTWNAATASGSDAPLFNATGDAGGERIFDTRSLEPYVVRLDVVDAQLQRASHVEVIAAANVAPIVDIGADQTVYWGETWAPIDVPILVGPSSGDANNSSCHYDWADGTTSDLAVCKDPAHDGADRNPMFLSHTWVEPGTYEVVLTATDPAGGAGEDRFFVEVVKRPSTLGLDPVPGALSGGPQPVTARLGDGFDATTAMPGKPVTFRLGTEIATALTDATGAATATLDFGVGTPVTVQVDFAGDALYTATSSAQAYPEALPPTTRTNCGTDFVFAMHRQCASDAECIARGDAWSPQRVSLFLTGRDGTSVQLTGGGRSGNVVVPPSGVVEVRYTESSEIGLAGQRSSNVFHVRAPREVCVVALTSGRFSTDGMLAIPTAWLGTEYIVGAWRLAFGVGDGDFRSAFTVAATVDTTSITITPAFAVVRGPDMPGTGASLPAGVPFTVTLDARQAMMFRAYTGDGSPHVPNRYDLTGTTVVASAPVAVTAGHQCSYVPDEITQACDYMIEQMPPLTELGRSFLATPFAGRASGYVLRAIAARDATEVRLDGAPVATLARGQFYEFDEHGQLPHVIETSEPALVMQYAKGTQSDSAIGDPFAVMVLPTSQFGSDAVTHTVPDATFRDRLGRRVLRQFANWLNLVAPVAEVGGVRVDGAPVTAAWNAIGTSGYAFAQVSVSGGYHRVQHVAPRVSVGIYVYGWERDDSYGYPGYMRLLPLDEACVASTSVAGDGVDNDCDGRIDEELADGLDDDGDALVDEDVSFTYAEPVNVAPHAYDAHTATGEDVPLDLALSGFDPNGDALTFEILSSPTLGVLSGTAPLVRYTPTGDLFGADTFTFRVCDPGALCSAPATVTITVRSVNDPPLITMRPIVSAAEDALFSLPCLADEARDIDPTCALRWELLAGPPGMVIETQTGDLYWIPESFYAGSTVVVTVRATDCHGASSTFSFGIEVGSVNDAPIITTTPRTDAHAGRPYSYDVDATDPDVGQTPRYALIAVPAWLAIDETTGVISGTPTVADIGRHEVEVVAVDPLGVFSAPQRFAIDVAGDTSPPVVTVTPTPTFLAPGETSVIAVTVADDEGATIESATIGGAPLALASTGVDTYEAVYTASAAGVLEIVVVAIDGAGNRGTGTSLIRVPVAGDASVPLVELTSPTEDALLTYLHEATGTVTDANLYRWTLELRRTDHGAWLTLATGTTNVTAAQLGTLDATQLENGYYVLRLRAEDVNGNVAEDQIAVRVDGGAKVGLVRLELTDLVFEDFGIPLAVTRVYDSRNASRRGDFGYGWDLDVRAGRVQNNRPTGADFSVYSVMGEFPCQRDAEIQNHFTLVTLSDSEWYAFRPTVANLDSISGACVGDVFWEFIDGTSQGATLDVVGNRQIRASTAAGGGNWSPASPPPPGNLRTFDGEIYDPQDFVLTLADGRVLRLSTERGIEQITDRNGNTLRIERDGFTHSSGRSMGFVRDAEGRITQVIDPAGRSVGYSYDGMGNLVRHTDVLARDTRYRYGSRALPHHLTSIVDHRGVEIAALEYQADGRIGRTCDPDGVCLRQSYDLAVRMMRQIDGLGRPMVYGYDDRGRVNIETDALGNTTSYTHNSDRMVRSMTRPDGSGFTRTFAWRSDNVESETQNTAPGEDPALFTTRATYDGQTPRKLTETLPTGGTTHYAYDTRGNQTSVSDDAGRVIFDRVYDTRGRPTSVTDRFGTMTYEYADDSARPTRVVYPDATDAQLTYDTMGNVATLTRAGVTMRYVHDAQGRMLFADYGRGISVRYEYNGAGDAWTAIEGPSFGRVERRFSGGGRLIGWTLPNGDAYSRTYDLKGNVTSETGPDGNTRNSFYDLAGRLERVEDIGRGATTRFERDGAGNVLATIDALGHRSESTYDLRGALRTLRDVRGQVSTFTETPQSSVRVDPLARTTTSARAAYGLPSSTTLPGGATTSGTYLGATNIDESGEYASTRIDELGRTRALSYDARSTLIGATDVGGVNAWTYSYAPVLGGDVSWDLDSGQVSLSAAAAEPGVGQYAGRDEARDATPEDLQNATGRALADVQTPSGEVTHRVFDNRGHLARIELPNGGIETRGYDAAGRHTSTTLAHGTTLTYVRDAANRVTARTGSDGSSQTYTYGPGDRVESFVDATGTTTLGYDAASRWTSMTSPTGAVWSRTYDALDRVTSVTVRAPSEATGRTTLYGYDEAGNVTRIEDPFGGVTTQRYDAAGQLIERTLPNGVVSSWAYNERGWVMEIVHQTATGDVIASARYERSASGEPTRIEREDVSAVDVGYDAALRVTSEAYSDDGETIGYGYDADSNRTSRITSARSETYAYLAGALLAAVTMASSPTETFAYDGAGRATDVRGGAVIWDVDDHVTAMGGRAWAFDAQGRRTRVDGVEHLVAPTLSESLESPWLVMDAGGAARVGYVYGGEHPLARYDAATGARVYYLADAMGSVIGLVGDSPSDRATIHYDGFGNVRRVEGSAAMAALPSEAGGDFRFQGMLSDVGTGLYYVRARVYDARTGRFLSSDPAEGSREDPGGYLAYAFANANPLTFSDPTGRTTVMDQLASGSILGQTEVGTASTGLQFMRSLQLAARGIVIATGLVGAAGAATGADDLVWDVGLQTIALLSESMGGEHWEVLWAAEAQSGTRYRGKNRHKDDDPLCLALKAAEHEARAARNTTRANVIKFVRKSIGCSGRAR